MHYFRPKLTVLATRVNLAEKRCVVDPDQAGGTVRVCNVLVGRDIIECMRNLIMRRSSV